MSRATNVVVVLSSSSLIVCTVSVAVEQYRTNNYSLAPNLASETPRPKNNNSYSIIIRRHRTSQSDVKPDQGEEQTAITWTIFGLLTKNCMYVHRMLLWQNRSMKAVKQKFIVSFKTRCVCVRACVRARVRAWLCVRERERERERMCVGGGGGGGARVATLCTKKQKN